MNFSRILSFVFVAVFGSQVIAMNDTVVGDKTTTLLSQSLELGQKVAGKTLEQLTAHPYIASGILFTTAIIGGAKYTYNKVTAKPTEQPIIIRSAPQDNSVIVSHIQQIAPALLEKQQAKLQKEATRKNQIETAKKAVVTQAFNCTMIKLNDQSLFTEKEIIVIEAYNKALCSMKPYINKKMNRDTVTQLRNFFPKVLLVQSFAQAYENLCKTLGA